MAALSLFEYRDYKLYLRTWIQTQERRGRGLKAALAQATHCNTTYIAQILNAQAHFSLEQAEKASRFLGHRYDETVFFLLLVQLARAGTPTLQELCEKQIERALEQQTNLKDRLEFQKILGVEDQLTYYSAWYYSAIHAVLSVKPLQTPDALSQYFGLPTQLVSEVLQFLVQSGLAVFEEGRYKTGPISIHLPKDSPAISKLHTNWRTKAIQSLEKRNNQDLHYSSVVAIAQKDQPRVREILIRAIEEIRSVVKESKEDSAHCYCVDLFSLKNEL